MPAAGHLILAPPIPYGFLHQRPQRLAAEFARLGWRVTYVEPAGIREYLRGERTGTALALQRAFMHAILALLPSRGTVPRMHPGARVPPPGSVAVFTLPVVVPHNRFPSALLERLNARIWRRALGSVPCRPDERTVLVANNPFWGIVLEDTAFRDVCYDAIDEIALYAGNAPLERFRRYERALVERSGVVFATARLLEEELRALYPGARVVRVPNGVDAGWWSEKLAAPAAHRAPAARGGPVVGYIGALYEWIDVGLVAEVARLMPDASFLLVGPADSPGRTAPLRGLPNVEVRGRVPYDDVPALVAACDVCIIPMTGVGRGANPVKLYEYFAAGKPVITTPMTEIEPFEADGLAAGAANAPAFASALRRAVAEDSEDRRRRRRDVARANSWAAQARRMLDALGPEGGA